jgi:tetratricopeptide (TPR) repeat protein
MRVNHAIATGRWDAADAFVLPAASDVEPTFTLAYGEALAAASGDLSTFHAAAARLRERQKEMLAAIAKQKQTHPADQQRAQILVQQIDALERIREGRKDEGIARLRQAAAAETAMALEFGPPAIAKPTWELLGDELLVLGRNAEAEQAYQSALTRAPGRTQSLQGLLRTQQARGETAAAARTREQVGRYVRTAAK